MKNLNNYHPKKLEETSPVPATQEKNTNTVMVLYDVAKKIAINIAKNIIYIKYFLK